LHIDARLNERRSGMDGLPVHMFNDQLCVDLMNFKTEHGESFLEQMERLRSFLDEIAERHSEGVILAVSHENPILAAQALIVDYPEQVAISHLDNCAWMELDW
jgi:broad specificity phosphatase PhoE